MPSIRKRLLLWLLPGLAIVWAAAGTGVYQVVKRAEFERLDAQLEKLEGTVRMFAAFAGRERQREREPRPEGPPEPRPSSPDSRPEPGPDSRRDSRPRPSMEERWPEFFTADGGAYFQVWDSEAEEIRVKSQSLGSAELPRPGSFGAERAEFIDTALPDGRRLRGYARTLRPWFGGRSRGRPGEAPRPSPEPMNLLIAIDAEPVRQTLASLLFGIVGAGVLAALASSVLVAFAVRNGLRPLSQLGERVDSIDATSLDERFPISELPAELSPISARLNELMGRLEASFERERRFSADLAHELRTPIAELRTLAEVALKWPDGDSREQSEETLQIATQMGAIIESLLALGRYENGQEELEPEDVSLADLSQSAWRPYAARAEERGIDVSFEIPDDQTLRTDPEMLRVVIGNLLSNAAEYTPEGGRIVVTGASGNGNGAVLSVSNPTDDLDEESIDHLFERFWRRDGARSDSAHCGLGLSLARACSRALSLDLGARLDPSSVLTISLKQDSKEKPNPSSPDNLASLN